MKLVEILARELTEWPEGTNFIFQDYDGEAWGDAGKESLYTSSNICEEHRKIGDDFPTSLKDKYCSLVTRAQWESERARIAMDCISAFSQEQDQAEQAVSQYEQELWDKACFEAWTIGMKEYASSGTLETMEILTTGSAALADAFMAERAKRLKQ